MKKEAHFNYLPDSNILNSSPERSLVIETQFKSVRSYLYEVIEQSTQCRQRECRREQDDVAILDKHLQVVVKRVLILKHGVNFL